MNQIEQKHWEDNKEWNDGGWKVVRDNPDQQQLSKKQIISITLFGVSFLIAIILVIIGVSIHNDVVTYSGAFSILIFAIPEFILVYLDDKEKKEAARKKIRDQLKALYEERERLLKKLNKDTERAIEIIDQIIDRLEQENNKPLPYKNLYNKNHRPARWSDSTSPEEEVERHLNGEVDYSDMSNDAQVLFEEEYNDD